VREFCELGLKREAWAVRGVCDCWPWERGEMPLADEGQVGCWETDPEREFELEVRSGAMVRYPER
jgi:hypothetical protein